MTAVVIAVLALACAVLGMTCAVLAWLVRQLHADLDTLGRPLLDALKRGVPE